MSFKPSSQQSNIEVENEVVFNPEVTLVIDADEFAYQVSAACEIRGILATNTTNEAQASFKTRTEMKDFLSGLEVPEGFFKVEDTQIAEPLKNAIATFKSKVNNLREKFSAGNVELYFSGKNNFRLDLLLPEQYKSNRKDQLRPLLLADLRDHLVKYHNAVVVDGDEADQMITQRMWDGFKSGKKIIGVSQDKDALSSMGSLYNPVKDELYFIDGFGEIHLNEKKKVKGYGRLWLYVQLLLGDWQTDRFCPRQIVKAFKGKSPSFGDVAAFNLLKDCKTDKEALTAVHAKYLEWFGSEEFSYVAWNGETFTGNYLDAMQMIWLCARMKRFDGDDIHIKDVLKKLKVIE